MASHEATTYVRTPDIAGAVKGFEGQVLAKLGIAWRPNGKTHIRCPYPGHGGDNDWRWDGAKGQAYCTCSKPHSIFDVLMKCEGVDFETAKIRVAETIGRPDLIRTRVNGKRYQATDPDSLLNPAPDNRDDGLVRAYL